MTSLCAVLKMWGSTIANAHHNIIELVHISAQQII